MPGLTVAEKNHWRDRIARRIDKKIESIWAEEPNLKERVEAEATRLAHESLGLAQVKAELDAIEAQRDELEKQENRLQRQALATVRGKPIDEVPAPPDYWNGLDPEVTQAVQRRAAVLEERLLTQDERGRRVLLLRAEKDNLLDTVWLATSSNEVKQLWARVIALLGDDQTPLQRDALAIPPVEE